MSLFQIGTRRDRTGDAEREAAAAAEAERLRLRDRANVKRGLANREIAQQRAAALDLEWKGQQARVEAGINEHQLACQVLQQELQTLEQRAVQRIRDRQPADPQEDARRLEIASLIGEQNRRLEGFLQLEKPLIRAAEKRSGDAWRQLQEFADVNALHDANLGNPVMRARLVMLMRQQHFAHLRVVEAHDTLRKLNDQRHTYCSPSDRQSFLRKLREAQAECDLATEYSGETDKKMRGLIQQMHDE